MQLIHAEFVLFMRGKEFKNDAAVKECFKEFKILDYFQDC